MRVALKKWGNSVSLRIPSPLMRELGLIVDQEVDLKAEAGRLTIEPIRQDGPRYTLDELLAQCDPSAELTAEDREWLDAEPVGRELL